MNKSSKKQGELNSLYCSVPSVYGYLYWKSIFDHLMFLLGYTAN